MGRTSLLISDATERNWNRLQHSTHDKLTRRANKTLSTKTILPFEYFSDRKNIKGVASLCLMVQKHEWKIASVILSLGINLLKHAGIINQPHVVAVLAEYSDIPRIGELTDGEIPTNEFDLLGLTYQCLLTEGEKSIKGSYYTPIHIAAAMTKEFRFSSGQTFLDPCCGSGIFFLKLEKIEPHQIFGIDSDPIAVLAAKINLLLKFPRQTFVPQIYCFDYLDRRNLDKTQRDFLTRQFDYIGSNPPWGAVSSTISELPGIKSKESFSFFFIRAFNLLNPSGVIRFLFPEAILKIRLHEDIRTFLLNNGRIRQIEFHDNSFSHVYTKYIDMEVEKAEPSEAIHVSRHNRSRQITLPEPSDSIGSNLTCVTHTGPDAELLQRIESKGSYDLSASHWALGIVTGNNRQLLKEQPLDSTYEPIITGKEVEPYRLKPAKKYIRYERERFQQVAKEELYRAPEKLIYKFISDKPVFAYDDTGALCLNSANILIPQIPGLWIKSVMALLNSDVLRFFYKKRFGDIKILKGNLLQLPFPSVDAACNMRLTDLADRYLAGDHSSERLIQQEVYSLFELHSDQITHIKRELHGTASE